MARIERSAPGARSSDLERQLGLLGRGRATMHRRWLPHWQDALLGLLGVWLFISPWVVATSSAAHAGGRVPLANPLLARIVLAIRGATWLDWVVGVLLVLAMLLAQRWLERVARLFALALGTLVFASPWIFGMIGPSDVISPSLPVMSGFAVLFFVLPGAGGLVWSNWLTGALIIVLALWSVLRPSRSGPLVVADAPPP